MQEPVPRKFNLTNLSEVVSLIPSDFEYFIWYGTLLGFYREKDIIKDDGDIDFYIDAKHRNGLIEIIESSDFKIRINTKDFLQAIKKFGDTETFVDFYYYENEFENDYISEGWTSSNYKDLSIKVPKKFIFPILTGFLKDISVRIPNNAEACCRFIYGESFMVPLKKISYVIYESIRMESPDD